MFLVCPGDLVGSCRGGPACADISMFELVKNKWVKFRRVRACSSCDGATDCPNSVGVRVRVRVLAIFMFLRAVRRYFFGPGLRAIVVGGPGPGPIGSLCRGWVGARLSRL